MSAIVHGVEVERRRARAVRGSRSPAAAPALRSTLNVARSDSSVCTPFRTSPNRSVPRRVVTRAKLPPSDAAPIVDAPARSVGNVVDVEDPCLGCAPEDADERAVDGVVEAERRQDQVERLPHGDVLQFADERLGDVRDRATTLSDVSRRSGAAGRGSGPAARRSRQACGCRGRPRAHVRPAASAAAASADCRGGCCAFEQGHARGQHEHAHAAGRTSRQGTAPGRLTTHA